MEDLCKYLTPGQEDIDWGLCCTCIGQVQIEPGVLYPPKTHPTGYYFTYVRGRILDEYQLNYITEGEGMYETDSGMYKIKPGSILITRPGIWHRYRPKMNTGWKEKYVGFKGHIADEVFKSTWFQQNKSVVEIGNREEIIDSYLKIFDYIQAEKPGYQQVTAGMIMKLLGFIVSIEKQKGFSRKRVEQIIQKACFTIRENTDSKVDFHEFAEENNIGYSYFRKMFKNYTGVPPVQYHLDLKLLRAKELLISSDKLIKEISYELGFESIYYFSRVYKSKLGVSPSEVRKSIK